MLIHGHRPRSRNRARHLTDRAPVRQRLDHEDGRARNAVQIEVIPTGASRWTSRSASAAFRAAAIIEIYGPESSGKTTLALHIIAEAQKMGGVAAFIDAEHALDPSTPRASASNLDELLISQPDTGEQALEIVETLVRTGAVDVVVIDSVAALVPKAEIDGDMGDSHVGLQARLMSPGAAQADRRDQPLEHLGHLHQPAPREDRRHVRQPGDDHRRPRAEVLRLGAPGHPPDRVDQGRARRRSAAASGQGRQEQGRAAVPPGRVRHHVQRGHLGRRQRARRGDRSRDRQEVRRLVLVRRRAPRPGP